MIDHDYLPLIYFLYIIFKFLHIPLGWEISGASQASTAVAPTATPARAAPPVIPPASCPCVSSPLPKWWRSSGGIGTPTAVPAPYPPAAPTIRLFRTHVKMVNSITRTETTEKIDIQIMIVVGISLTNDPVGISNQWIKFNLIFSTYTRGKESTTWRTNDKISVMRGAGQIN